MNSSTAAQISEKFIRVEGSINLRDFGGYQTEDGRSVRSGLLFRCGSMTTIPEHAFGDFADLDIGVICDLRSDQEVDEAPTPTGGPFECRVHIPIWPGSSTQFQETVLDRRPDKNDFIRFMETITREIARDHVHAYTQLMRELIETDRGFLLHCSAGKDRTGFGAAIILSMLGVSRETVFHDYLVSNQSTDLMERMRARIIEDAEKEGQTPKIDDSIIAIFAGVREEYLQGAFEEIDENFGGLQGYLDAVGLSENDVQQLRQRLLV